MENISQMTKIKKNVLETEVEIGSNRAWFRFKSAECSVTVKLGSFYRQMCEFLALSAHLSL